MAPASTPCFRVARRLGAARPMCHLQCLDLSIAGLPAIELELS
jgi:hypothetical protein